DKMPLDCCVASDPSPAPKPSRALRSKSRLTLLPPIRLPRSGVENRAPASVFLNGFWSRLLPLRKPNGELIGRDRFAVSLASVAAAAPARPYPKACTSADLFIEFIFHPIFQYSEKFVFKRVQTYRTGIRKAWAKDSTCKSY